MGTLTGKTAVVTGSTSGIGLAYARAFAGAGANIVLNGMGTPADIEKERAAIESDFKVKAVHSPADMTKPAEIAGMIEHWNAGARDVHLSMRHKEWLERPQPGETMVTYDLTGDGSETFDDKQEQK